MQTLVSHKNRHQFGGSSVLLIILAGLLVLGVVAYFVLQEYATSKAKEEVDAVVTTMRSQGAVDLTYSDVSYDLLGQNVVISDVDLKAPTGGGYTVEEVVVRDYDTENDIPEYFAMEVNNFLMEVNESNFNEQWEDIRALGYETIQGDMVIDYRIDNEAQTFVINELSLDAVDFCEMKFSVSLGSITVNEATLMAYLFDPSSITVTSASLSYTDDSLVVRAMEQAAREEDLTLDEVKNQALQGIDEAIEEARQAGSERGVLLMEAVKTFILDPGTLSITMNPPQPVSVGQLTETPTPFEALDLMHMEVEVN
ncbi:MAG: hypothetical protein D6E12_14430 [Desulfovibrio sp.]|nr:MAG: hypothetical protein D6E12_14430 [Desulfovibrio sp.]